MKILVINTGSSSIKFQLFDMMEDHCFIHGLIEEIGTAESHFVYQSKRVQVQEKRQIESHRKGLQMMAELLSKEGLEGIDAVGHRVVHGGEDFSSAVVVDESVLAKIQKSACLAPLHNPSNLAGIEITQELFQVPQVAVFDTAFHQSIPAHAYRYALPESLYLQHQVRRYGFHGQSHGYVAKKAAEFLEQPLEELKLISLHLGNGCSACAIRGGQSIDTSMGMTPLEGLMMGSRCGDLDPAILMYLLQNQIVEFKELEHLLNRQSGLKGICGENDLRTIEQQIKEGRHEAKLALNLYAYRIQKYIGSYFAVLGGLDALIFTAGVGENSVLVRQKVCENLQALGIELDSNFNQKSSKEARCISKQQNPVKVLVIPTNEEYEIAQQTMNLIACHEQNLT